MAFAAFLHNRGVLSDTDFAKLDDEYVNKEISFGTLAFLLRYIDLDENLRVLQKQVATTKPFSEIVVEIGSMTREQVETVRAVQSKAISLGDLVLASRILDRDAICYYLGLFALQKTVV